MEQGEFLSAGTDKQPLPLIVQVGELRVDIGKVLVCREIALVVDGQASSTLMGRV